MRQMLSGVCRTLHLYILWPGNGHRIANFIKQWTLSGPEDLTNGKQEDRTCALQNVIEMVFCCAFHSLTRLVLEKYIQPSHSKHVGSDTGLDIIPPLLQGMCLGASIEHSFNIPLSDSKDSEIKAWRLYDASITSKKGKQYHPGRHFPFVKAEYEVHLQKSTLKLVGEAIGHVGYSLGAEHSKRKYFYDMKMEIERCALEINGATGKLVSLVHPYGNLNARIDLVPDYGNFGTDEGNLSQTTLKPPEALSRMEFNNKNSLIWCFHLRQCNRILENEIITLEAKRLTLSEDFMDHGK